MKCVHHLAALALAPMLVGPVVAGGYGRCYAPPVYYAPPVVKYKDRIVYRDRVTVIEKPVIVPQAVSYLATIIPAATYNLSTTINAPPPAVQTVQATLSTAALAGAAVPVAVGRPAVAAAPCPSHAELQARLDRLERQYSGHAPQQPEPRAPAGLDPQGYDVGALLVRRCASCHDASVSALKGGDLTIFEGGRLLRLDTPLLDKVLASVLSDRMPKGGPALSQDEKYWLGVFVDQEKRAPSPVAAAQ